MPAKLTFHAACHAWAYLARRSGRDVYDIIKGMRHSGPAMTENYFASGEGKVIDAQIRS